MKSLIVTSILSLAFIFISCEDQKALTFLEINMTAENNSIVETNIPQAIGTSDISNNINENIENVISGLLNIGDADDVSVKTVEESITLFNNEFQSFKNDFPESAQQWEAQIDGDVMYQSPEIVSIALTSYINTGGAHGILTINILNFNTETGLKISNDSLFTNMDAFKSVAKPYFEKTIKEKGNNFFDTDVFELPSNIGFSEEGVILLYNVYEIAPYSTGITEFTIPYDQISALLKFN